MNKDKLIEYCEQRVLTFTDEYDTYEAKLADKLFSELLNAIDEGKFDKEPCEMCLRWESTIRKGYNVDAKYCTECGRKLVINNEH